MSQINREKHRWIRNETVLVLHYIKHHEYKLNQYENPYLKLFSTIQGRSDQNSFSSFGKKLDTFYPDYDWGSTSKLDEEILEQYPLNKLKDNLKIDEEVKTICRYYDFDYRELLNYSYINNVVPNINSKNSETNQYSSSSFRTQTVVKTTSNILSFKDIDSNLDDREVGFDEIKKQLGEFHKIHTKSIFNYRHEKYKLREILDAIKRFEIAVPSFQREFSWKIKDNIIPFLNFLISGKPFGQIIIWDQPKSKSNSDKLIKIRNEWFEGYKDNRDNTPDKYIIDGQQRLTTILFALFKILPKKIKGKVVFNLTKQKFQEEKEVKDQDITISAENLIDFEKNKEAILKDWQEKNIISKVDDDEKILVLQLQFEKIGSMLLEIEIGVLKIDGNLSSVIDTFTKINTKGKKLRLYDVIHAEWLDPRIEIDLDEKDKKMRNFHKEKGLNFNNASKRQETFIKSLYIIIDSLEDKKEISLSNHKIINYDLDFLKNKVKEEYEKYEKIIKKTHSYLSGNRYLFSKEDKVWNTSIYYGFIYFYSLFPENLKPETSVGKPKEQLEAFNKYIHLSLINLRYSGSVNVKLQKDFENAKRIKNEEIDKYNVKNLKVFDVNKIDEEIIRRSTYDSKNTSYKLFINVLTKEFKNLSIQGHENTGIHVHHIFPRKYKLDDGTNIEDVSGFESLANLTIVGGAGNQQFGSKHPKDAFKKIVSSKNDDYENEIREKLESHLISWDKIKEVNSKEKFEEFLKIRTKKLVEKLNQWLDLN